MRILKKMLRQKAVYWEPIGTDQYAEPVYGEPLDIKCRWEDTATRSINDLGSELIYSSRIFVDRVVKNGGKLLKGEIADLDSPNPPAEAKQIRLYEEVPTLKATKSLKIAYL